MPLKNTIPLLFILALGIANAVLILFPPMPAGDDEPLADFSAARAIRVVGAIAQRPHPIGSLDNVRVRDWLAEEMERLGWKVELESDLIFQGDHSLTRAQNVYARLPGLDSQGAVLLTAHYDSVPFGPGAADDCAGIAAIVEAARALSASPQMRNDVILCLSDGEEGGLRGAKTLLEHAPWAADVAVVVNFEARGVRGPSLMFQSTADAAWLKDFFKTAPYPVASSAMEELAALMPTRTEFYVYRDAGYKGFDFAFIRGLEYYHTMNDSPENLDRGSLQHHGSYALSLAKHFGESDFKEADDSDELVYFNLFGHWIVYYPASWTGLLAWTVASLALCPLIGGLLRRRFGLKQAALAAALLLISIPVIVLINVITPFIGLNRFGPYAVYNQPWYILGYLALTLACLLPYTAWISRKVGLPALASICALFMGLLLIGLYHLFPAGAYLLIWPLAGLVVSACVIVFTQFESGHRAYVILLSLCALPTVLLLPPILFMGFDAFTLVLGPIFMILVWLMVMLIVPTISEPLNRLPHWTWIAPFVIALGANSIAVFDTRFTPERPKMYDLRYGYDSSSKRAWWMTTETSPEGWLGGFFPNAQPWNLSDILPGENKALIRSPAPKQKSEPGSVVVEKVEEHNGVRTYTIKVQPGMATNGFELYTPEANKPIEARVDGRIFGTTRKTGASWLIRYQGRCDDGLTIELDVKVHEMEEPLLIYLTEHMVGFPDGPDAALADRPDWLIPMANTMPTYDISWDTVKSLNLFQIIRFGHGNGSNGSLIHSSYQLDKGELER